ncbi:FliO/MopB family protein [Microbacterium marinilacus]|uniref:Flagellar protein n=1 Tax=Microbacterium marinilacus TaxID=415209 RepID=A0ABP7BSM2_9MICO|nr:flagellar biosynthetic protein FliO [Microbacterium marinilacus]MBY0687717.1 flagellar biosynthetic protein FliO [Microbacterium marinilacus]
MLGLLWFLQRRIARGTTGRTARGRREERISVLSRRGLGGKAQLVVVEIEGTRYVLGVTEHGISVVDRARAPQRIGEPGAGSTPAADVVSEFERLLAEAADADSPAKTGPDEAEPALRRDRRSARPGGADPLRGSILSPETWRQTAAALRTRR